MINFKNHPSITEIVIPNGINLINNDFSNAFNDIRTLVTSELNHPNVINMFNTY